MSREAKTKFRLNYYLAIRYKQMKCVLIWIQLSKKKIRIDMFPVTINIQERIKRKQIIGEKKVKLEFMNEKNRLVFFKI